MSQYVSKTYTKDDILSIKELRDEYIKLLDTNLSEDELYSISEDLFSLGLTVYSKDRDFDSILYNALSKSLLDNNISLYPEQKNLISQIERNEALIVSAPTSFGKTFCVFEYIAIHKPKNVVLIVPTLALVDEYIRKIISKYKSTFYIYKKYINIDENININYEGYNMFILTHDKAVENNSFSIIKKIDFLVIDEVYKLKTEQNDDRVLVLNLAYYYLSKKARKYVLLAPFILDIEDRNKLEKKPKLFKTDFSPVVNELETINVNNSEEKITKITKLIKDHDKEKTLIYFPKVSDIPKFVNECIVKYFPIKQIQDQNIKNFINWIKDEIHEEWYVVKAMERGFLIHNGQLPNNGFRMYQLDMYNQSNEFYNLICTSTILEGVNLCAKNIIITSPARYINKFDAFDFYNLVGRTGRLYEHYLGNAFYLKGPNDPIYNIKDAVKLIKFEVTSNDEDFNFYANNDIECLQYEEFLKELNITAKEYKENIGPKFKIKTILETYKKFNELKKELLKELEALYNDNTKGRQRLIEILYKIINYDKRKNKLEPYLINKLIYKNRLKIKNIIQSAIKIFKDINLDYIISTTLKLKSGYIEHEYYSMLKVIVYFMKCNQINETYINIINDKIISSIETIYFSNSKCKKTLKDLGIYEYDIDKITKVIGDKYNDINEIKDALKTHEFKNLNFISEYIIKRL